MNANYMDNFLDWLESTTPEERLGRTSTEQTRPWPYDGPEGRARLTGSLDTGGSFTGDDDDDSEYAQSSTACCPRQTIPDSCSCLEGCECMCLDCICGAWGEEYEDD